jgi:hypothetical protein
MGETIAFSVCNKPFKLLWLFSGRVKYLEGLPGMILTNILKHSDVIKQRLSQKHMVNISWVGLTKWTSHHQDVKNQSNSSWKIETTHAPISAKWD